VQSNRLSQHFNPFPNPAENGHEMFLYSELWQRGPAEVMEMCETAIAGYAEGVVSLTYDEIEPFMRFVKTHRFTVWRS